MLPHLPVFPILLYFIGALLVVLVGRWTPRAAWVTAMATSLVTLATAIVGIWKVSQVGTYRYAVGGWAPPVGIELVLDPLSSFLLFVLSFIGCLVILHSGAIIQTNKPLGRMPYYSCALLLLGGFSGIVMAGDLFNLYVFLEISALAGYGLFGIGHARASLATFRYLILGTMGASFYLLGIAFLFFSTGSLNVADVAAILQVTGQSPSTVFGLLLIFLGMALKMALFPLHLWLPDAYTYAPSSSTALLAPLGTKIAAYVLIRLFYGIYSPGDAVAGDNLLWLLSWMGAAGIVWGSVMAIPQDNFKRMLAYSSIAQIGYIALGIGLGNALGFIGALLHVLNHACMKSCLFMVSANFEFAGCGQKISGFRAATRRMLPWSSAALTVSAISMIGLPPTAGFFSKWYLLLGSWEAGQPVFLAIILVSSLLNAVYFFRILENLYVRPDPVETATPKMESSGRPSVGPSMVVPVLLLALVLLVAGLANLLIVEHVLRPSLPAALHLLPGG